MAGKQDRKISIILAILFIIIFLVSFVFPDTFQLWNAQVNDLFFKFRFMIKGKEKLNPSLHFFTISDSFDREYSTNHIDRTIYAFILEKLHSSHIQTILWDIMFSDKRPGDDKLVAITEKSGNIYYPFYFKRNQSGKEFYRKNLLVKKYLFIPAFIKGKGNPYKVDIDTIHYPFKELALAAAGLGSSNAYPDKDLITRRLPLFYESDQGYIPSLVLAGICGYFQVDLSRIGIHYGRYISLPGARYYGITKELKIRIDRKGQMIINFPGPVRRSLFSYPLEKVMKFIDTDGEENQVHNLLENTFVFIGDISTRGKDFSRGVFDQVYPNSFMLGSAINTILTENFLSQSNPVKDGILAVLVPSLALLFWVLFRDQYYRGFLGLLLLFSSLLIFLILGVNAVGFIFFNNLPRTVELLTGTLCAVFILIMMKARYSQAKAPAPVTRKQTKETVNPVEVLKSMRIVTKRRLETALLLLEGLSNQEIADRLYISVPAVKKRIHQIYKICKVKKRSELIKKIYGIK